MATNSTVLLTSAFPQLLNEDPIIVDFISTALITPEFPLSDEETIELLQTNFTSLSHEPSEEILKKTRHARGQLSSPSLSEPSRPVVSSVKKKTTKTVQIGLLQKDLPLEIWSYILLFLPVKFRFQVAPVCWTTELACLSVLSQTYSDKEVLHADLPKPLRRSLIASLPDCRRGFFIRRVMLEQERFVTKDDVRRESWFMGQTRLETSSCGNGLAKLHQFLLPDSRAEDGKSKLFGFLPGRSNKFVAGLQSSPTSFALFDLTNPSCREQQRVDTKETIHMLALHPKGQLIVTGSRDSLSISREENGKFSVTARLQRSGIQDICVGDTMALVSSATRGVEVLQLNDSLSFSLLNERDPSSFLFTKLVHAGHNRFLLGDTNGAVMMLDERQKKLVSLAQARREVGTFSIPPVFVGNPHMVAVTTWNTNRLEVFSSSLLRAQLSNEVCRIRALAVTASEHYVVVGNVSGASLYDMRCTRLPVSKLHVGIPGEYVHLDGSKYTCTDGGVQFGVADYKQSWRSSVLSQFELKQMEFAPNETWFASNHLHQVAITMTRQNRQDLPKSKRKEKEPVETGEEFRKRMSIEKRRRQMRAAQAQSEMEVRMKRDQQKSIADLRWNKFKE